MNFTMPQTNLIHIRNITPTPTLKKKKRTKSNDPSYMNGDRPTG